MEADLEWIGWSRAARMMVPATGNERDHTMLIEALCEGEIRCTAQLAPPHSLVQAEPLTGDWFRTYTDPDFSDRQALSAWVTWCRDGDLRLARADVDAAMRKRLPSPTGLNEFGRSGQWTIAQAVTWLATGDAHLSDGIVGGISGGLMHRAGYEIAKRCVRCAATNAELERWQQCTCAADALSRLKQLLLSGSIVADCRETTPLHGLTCASASFQRITNTLRPLLDAEVRALRLQEEDSASRVVFADQVNRVEIHRESLVATTPNQIERTSHSPDFGKRAQHLSNPDPGFNASEIIAWINASPYTNGKKARAEFMTDPRAKGLSETFDSHWNGIHRRGRGRPTRK